jgi:hypothetical protein
METCHAAACPCVGAEQDPSWTPQQQQCRRRDKRQANSVACFGQNCFPDALSNQQTCVDHLPTTAQTFLLDSELDKFLVFAHHTILLDAAEKAANGAGAHYIRIDGSVPASRRGGLVRTFQEDASCRVAILSIKAAGTGLTLTSASTVIFAEMYWVPGDLQQAEDRVHRVGQSCSVDCNYLLLAGSIDDRMWDMLQNKMRTTGQILNGHKGSLSVSFCRNCCRFLEVIQTRTGLSGLFHPNNHCVCEASLLGMSADQKPSCTPNFAALPASSLRAELARYGGVRCVGHTGRLLAFAALLETAHGCRSTLPLSTVKAPSTPSLARSLPSGHRPSLRGVPRPPPLTVQNWPWVPVAGRNSAPVTGAARQRLPLAAVVWRWRQRGWPSVHARCLSRAPLMVCW